MPRYQIDCTRCGLVATVATRDLAVTYAQSHRRYPSGPILRGHRTRIGPARPTPRPRSLSRTALRQLSDLELEQRLQTARAPTLAQLARETRPLRREWLRRQAARPVDAAAAGREVGRLIEAAEQHGGDRAMVKSGQTVGRGNRGRRKPMPQTWRDLEAVFDRTPTRTYRDLLTRLRQNELFTVNDAEENVTGPGWRKPITFKTLANIVTQLRRQPRRPAS